MEAVGPFQTGLRSSSAVAAVAVPLAAADGALVVAVATRAQRVLVELRARQMCNGVRPLHKNWYESTNSE